MPRYLVSDHALLRLEERFPTLSNSLAEDAFARKLWLARWVCQGKSIGAQKGRDLLLSCHVPGPEGINILVCAVSPLLAYRHPDSWSVRTVLTLDMALENSARAQEEIRQASQRRRTQQRYRRSMRLRMPLSL